MLHRFVSIPLTILALALPAHAAPRHVSERRSIEPDGTVSIELLTGSGDEFQRLARLDGMMDRPGRI